jgi:hypothetical protein
MHHRHNPVQSTYVLHVQRTIHKIVFLLFIYGAGVEPSPLLLRGL